MARWIDTHCHVYDETTPGGTDGSLAAARDASVAAMIVIGTDADTSQQAIDIASRHSDVWATVGLHPHDASRGFDTIAGFIDAERPETQANRRIVAIGECGLDFYYDHSARDVQRDVFARHIELANRARLPLVIHTRNAWDDTFDVLDTEGMPERTIFHCFTGSANEARACVERGAYLSFSGIVTFGNAEDIREAARWCPRDRIVIETDAPWLAPVPHRGRKNEPAHVAVIGEFLAAQRGESIDEFAAVTCANAAAAFPGIAR